MIYLITDYVITLDRDDWYGLAYDAGLSTDIQLPDFVTEVTVNLTTKDILNIVVSGKKKDC